MKNVFTFCCALCLLALTACGHAPKVSEEASDLEVNNHEGVTMTVVDGSAYPGQVKVTILNATDTEIDSGNSADFFLQVEPGRPVVQSDTQAKGIRQHCGRLHL